MQCTPCSLMLPLMLGLIVGVNTSAGWGVLAGLVVLALNSGLSRFAGVAGCPVGRRRSGGTAHPELSQPVVDAGVRLSDRHHDQPVG